MYAKKLADRLLNIMTSFLLLLCGWMIVEYKLPAAFADAGAFDWMLAWKYLYGHMLVWLICCCVILAFHRLFSRDA